LTILLHCYKIDTQEFLNFIQRNDIDFSHYQYIRISNIIEYFIFYQNVKNNALPNIKAINHTDPVFNNSLFEKDKAIDIFQENESMIQANQMHADLLLYTLSSNYDGIVEIDKFYRDVKADFKGPSKGHITVKPFIFRDLKLANKHMNDYTSHLTTIIKSNSYANLSLED
jgi:hypothetical protein